MDGKVQKAENWSFKCIESAQKLAQSAIAFLSISYMVGGLWTISEYEVSVSINLHKLEVFTF